MQVFQKSKDRFGVKNCWTSKSNRVKDLSYDLKYFLFVFLSVFYLNTLYVYITRRLFIILIGLQHSQFQFGFFKNGDWLLLELFVLNCTIQRSHLIIHVNELLQISATFIYCSFTLPRWSSSTALRIKGLQFYPNTTLQCLYSLIIFLLSSSPHRNFWKFLSSSITSTIKKAFLRSAIAPIFFIRNLSRMEGMISSRFGPFSKQLFSEGFLPTLHDASNTGQTGVVTLTGLNTGLCGR